MGTLPQALFSHKKGPHISGSPPEPQKPCLKGAPEMLQAVLEMCAWGLFAIYINPLYDLCLWSALSAKSQNTALCQCCSGKSPLHSTVHKAISFAAHVLPSFTPAGGGRGGWGHPKLSLYQSCPTYHPHCPAQARPDFAPLGLRSKNMVLERPGS